MPLSFKLFIGLFVDLKVVSKRKYILGFFGLVMMVASTIIASDWTNSSDRIIWPFTLMVFSAVFLDATIDSIIV